LKVVSSLTSLHYLWWSLGPFSLPCAQKWPYNTNHHIMDLAEVLSFKSCFYVAKDENLLTFSAIEKKRRRVNTTLGNSAIVSAAHYLLYFQLSSNV